MKKKVLAVDDELVQQLMVKRALKDHFLVETVSSGTEALARLPDFRPDVILLDVQMPEMTGLEVCRIIRQNPAFHFTKIVIVSGKITLDDRLRGYKAGADDYLTKPFDEGELLAKVKVFGQLKKSEEVDQIKSDLLRVFSHETRTPLNGIFLASEILEDAHLLPERSRQLLGLVIDSGNKLLQLVEKTTLLCNLKSGTELTIRKNRVRTFLEQTIGKQKEKADLKNILFSLEGDEGIELEADWSLLPKVFGYLLDNAVKFSPADTTVRVLVTAEDDSCLIRVSDQGEGVASEQRDAIFSEFATKEVLHHHSGHGLSLAISRHIVEELGGSLTLENPAVRGATFVVRLPRVQAVV